MANKEFNTRIRLKYDTYANWVKNNPVLDEGEVAIATIANGDTQTVNSVETPQVLIKVGDGTNRYSDLKFVSGLAADVYGWAKAATKPSYAASEITGLSDFISGEIQDTDTQYNIVKVDNYNYKFQKKDKDAPGYTDVITITIPEYILPKATASVLGGVKIGSNVSIAADGTISLTKENVTAALGYTPVNPAAAALTGTPTAPTADPSTNSTQIATTAFVKSAIDAIPAQAEYTIKKLDTATEGYLASYQLEKDGAVSGAVINIPKDYLVKSASCKTATEDNKPIAGLKIGDKYLDFVINTKDSTASTGDHVYVNVADLVDTYTAGDNIKIENNKISVDPGVNKSFIDKSFADNVSTSGNTTTIDQQLKTYSITTRLEADVVITGLDESGQEVAKHKLSEKANTADLAAVATSGKINDLTLEAGTTLIFNCGDSNF